MRYDPKDTSLVLTGPIDTICEASPGEKLWTGPKKNFDDPDWSI